MFFHILVVLASTSASALTIPTLHSTNLESYRIPGAPNSSWSIVGSDVQSVADYIIDIDGDGDVVAELGSKINSDGLVLRPAPYFNKEGSLDEGFGNEYKFSPEQVQSFPVEGSYDERFCSAFHTLDQTSSLSILVLGGSEAAGVQCVQDLASGQLTGNKCAWSGRLKRILQASAPGISVKLINLAHGGTTTSVILGGIGVVLQNLGKEVPLDTIRLVLIDTLVNDAQEAKSFGASLLPYDEHNVVSLAYERLVRELNDLLPNAAIFSLLAACPLCNNMLSDQQKVIEHYKIANVDYHNQVQKDETLWKPADVHPDWETHQLIADMIASVWSKALNSSCLSPSPHFFPDGPLASATDLDALPACTKPLSSLSAFISFNDPQDNDPEPSSGWELKEDREGKPGWISEGEGHSLRARLKFGADPKLVVSYLRSYEGLGNAFVILNGKKTTLHGLWGEDNLQRVSQTCVSWFDAGLDVQQETLGDLGANGFGVKPNQEAEIEIISAGPEKFKLIEISSC